MWNYTHNEVASYTILGEALSIYGISGNAFLLLASISLFIST